MPIPGNARCYWGVKTFLSIYKTKQEWIKRTTEFNPFTKHALTKFLLTKVYLQRYNIDHTDIDRSRILNSIAVFLLLQRHVVGNPNDGKEWLVHPEALTFWKLTHNLRHPRWACSCRISSCLSCIVGLAAEAFMSYNVELNMWVCTAVIAENPHLIKKDSRL